RRASHYSRTPRPSSAGVRQYWTMLPMSSRAIERRHAGASQAKVVLQPDAGTGNLTCPRRPAQLVRELIALRESGRPKRVAFGKEAARRISDHLAAVRVVAVVHKPLAGAFGAEPERFVGEQLVVRETVVQLDDIDV